MFHQVVFFETGYYQTRQFFSNHNVILYTLRRCITIQLLVSVKERMNSCNNVIM